MHSLVYNKLSVSKMHGAKIKIISAQQAKLNNNLRTPSWSYWKPKQPYGLTNCAGINN